MKCPEAADEFWPLGTPKSCDGWLRADKKTISLKGKLDKSGGILKAEIYFVDKGHIVEDCGFPMNIIWILQVWISHVRKLIVEEIDAFELLIFGEHS